MFLFLKINIIIENNSTKETDLIERTKQTDLLKNNSQSR